MEKVERAVFYSLILFRFAMKRLSLLSVLFCISSSVIACTEGNTPASQCAETDPAICLGPNAFAVCRNGSLIGNSCNIGTSCLNGQCVPVVPPVIPEDHDCTAADQPVCAGPNAVRSCTGGKWQNSTCPDAQVCANGICVPSSIEQPGCTSADVPVCESANSVKSCYNGTWVSSPCAANYTCVNGKCASDTPITECSASDRPVCEGTNAIKSCVDGKWQTSACPDGQTCTAGSCRASQPTNECSVADLPVCEGSNAIKSCVDGKWQTSACPNGQTCTSGSCKESQPTNECTVADLPVCEGSNAIKSCVDGKWQTSACGGAQVCTAGKCVSTEPALPTTGTLADVGKACNIDTFKDSCDSNQIIFCASNGKIESSDLCDLWLEYSGVDMKCHIINGIAGCVLEEDTCSSPSETVRCSKSDTPTEIHEGCGKAEDGKLYSFDSFSKLCSGECKDGVGCVEIPENEKCDPGSFVEKCEVNQIISCKNGRIVRTACPSSQICNEFPSKNTARCTSPTPCNDLGETITCKYIPTSSGDDTDDFASIDVCMTAKDGKNYSYQLEYNYCEYRCDPARGCVLPVKDEGKECSEYTYTQRCQNNAAVFCDPFSEMVDVIYCKTGFTCLTEPDKYTNDAGCYDNVESLCNKAGELSYKCSDSGNYSSSTEYICKKMSDNKLHNVFQDFETCKNGCDANTGRCK